MTRESLSPEAMRDFFRRVLLRQTQAKIERAILIRRLSEQRRRGRPC